MSPTSSLSFLLGVSSELESSSSRARLYSGAIESFVESETTESFVSSASIDAGLLLSANEVFVSSSRRVAVFPFARPWLLSSEVVVSKESPFWCTIAGGIELPFSKRIPIIKNYQNFFDKFNIAKFDFLFFRLALFCDISLIKFDTTDLENSVNLTRTIDVF